MAARAMCGAANGVIGKLGGTRNEQLKTKY